MIIVVSVEGYPAVPFFCRVGTISSFTYDKSYWYMGDGIVPCPRSVREWTCLLSHTLAKWFFLPHALHVALFALQDPLWGVGSLQYQYISTVFVYFGDFFLFFFWLRTCPFGLQIGLIYIGQCHLMESAGTVAPWCNFSYMSLHCVPVRLTVPFSLPVCISYIIPIGSGL